MNLRMVRSLQFELFNYFANYLREKRNERDFEEITKYIQQLRMYFIFFRKYLNISFCY